MRVQEIMSTPVRTIAPADTAAEAWERMRLHRVRHLVVVDDDHTIAGMLSAGDLGGRNGGTLRNGRLVCDLMTPRVIVAHTDTTIREAANLMRGHVIECLPVLEDRRLAGVVTALDMLDLIGRGAERPVATADRRILKDRGVVPHKPSLTASKAVPNARRNGGRATGASPTKGSGRRS